MDRETDARIVIDRLLREARWDIENKSQVSTEEPAKDGRADYLLKNTRTQPLAIVEAKRFSIDPYGAKKQTESYARSLCVPFIILSNGHEHYFWDYADGDARPILGLPTQADLERRANLKIHRRGSLDEFLKSVPYPEKFRFKGEEIETRPYQLECLKKADEALIVGRRRMLFEMATGTGKTLTISMLMKRWFQAAIISRVLFLAHALRSLRSGGRAGIIFPNGILFGDTNSHIEVKRRLLKEFDLQAVVTLPKGMFEPYTPNPTCFFIFQKTGKPTKNVWF